jgi:Trk K+ transport system NAD-binding subunit
VQLIVVGAGGITRDLLRGLSEAWHVAVIDPDAERLDALRGVRGQQPSLVEGDGTSRVVLERAGLERADAVVAATGDDRANLEVCRIAKAAGIARIAAVAAGPESIGTYRNEDFAAFSPAQLTARRLEIQIEPRRISSAAFAEGLAQAIEFRIAADSPLIGRPLRELELERTLIAAISRRGSLIVPHGATALEEGDLVTVVCATADYQAVVRSFTTAAARFPSDLGRLVAVRLHGRGDLERLVPQAIHIVRNSAAEGLLLLHTPMEDGPEARTPAPPATDDAADDTRDEDDSGERTSPGASPDGPMGPRALIDAATAMAEGITVSEAQVESGDPGAVIPAARAAHAGVVVLPAPGGRFGTVRLLRAAAAERVAVVVARGVAGGESRTAYRVILAPALETPAGRAAYQAAIDLAVHGKAQLIGIAIRPPLFMGGTEARSEATLALARMREAASVHGIVLRRMVREGNPVRVLRAEAENADLLVLGVPAVTPRVWAPGIAGHVVMNAPCSILLVPPSGGVRGT